MYSIFFVVGFSRTKSSQAQIEIFVGMVPCSLKEMRKILSDWISFLLKLKERENEPLTNPGAAGNSWGCYRLLNIQIMANNLVGFDSYVLL